MQFDRPVAICIFNGDETRTLHREGLPGLTHCGDFAFGDHPLIGAEIAVIEDGNVPDEIQPKCLKCFSDAV
jgi:hypothetical protein